MDKDEAIKKIQEDFPNISKQDREKIANIIRMLPKPTNIKFIPKDIKKGDIYFSWQLGHSLVIYKVLDDGVICLMLTSENGIPCDSRYIIGTFSYCICKSTMEQLSSMIFNGIYGNNKHLTEVYNQLKTIL